MQSRICVEEFLLAYDQLVQGRRQHIIVLMIEKIYPDDLPPELENYLNRHTYIEAYYYDKEMDIIRERIRCAMPNKPLKMQKASVILIVCSDF